MRINLNCKLFTSGVSTIYLIPVGLFILSDFSSERFDILWIAMVFQVEEAIRSTPSLILLQGEYNKAFVHFCESCGF